MAVTFVREILTDGKAAIKVNGAPFSPAWFRVRLLDKDLVYGPAGVGSAELMVRAAAYQVDATGATVADGEGPNIRRRITSDSLALGTVSMTNEKKSIARQAIKKATQSLVDIGAIAQMSSELVD